MSGDATRTRTSRPGSRLLAGMAAVGAKELRGRMRGRRAFAIVTIYLLLLSLFAWGIYQFKLEVAGDIFVNGGSLANGGFNSALQATTRSAEIGHALFAGLLVLLTVLVLVLAPALTSGAISQEREKQTLELLVATPLSTTGMVISKLLSALVYLFLLILASIPVASVVFTFGGVGPDDVLRAYVLLFATAFGVGAIGLFFSAVARRTQVATVLTYVTVLTVTLGSFVLWVFWYGVASSGSNTFVDGRFVRRLPPQQMVWMNPFIADLDVMCGAGLDRACAVVGEIVNRPWFGSLTSRGGIDRGFDLLGILTPDVGPSVTGDLAPVAEPEAAPDVENDVRDCVDEPCKLNVAGAVQPGDALFTPPRDVLWPQVALTFTGVGLLLTIVSAQLVAPTRRLRIPRFPRPGIRRRAPAARGSTVDDPGTAVPSNASAGEPSPPAASWHVTPVQPVHGPQADPPVQESSR